MKRFIVFALAALTLAGCVTTKKYDAMRAQAMRAEHEAETAKAAVASLETERDRLQASIDDLRAKVDSLEAANARLSSDYAALRDSYDKMLKNASAEAARMLRELEANQKELDHNKQQLAKSQAELDARAAKMSELEAALNARDAALTKIKQMVSDALTGFEGKGLTITQRGGKIYVSMEDKLLFRSGSYTIDPNGAQAVRDLSTVLAANPDIDVVVEGHTDDVRYRQGTGQLRDNLDLSVMRATTVTRLLLENQGINPTRIVSAGMGEWMPVDRADTDAARQSNRRTEIILTPKLDELLKIIE
jgi:chemotaxis protein MotB